MNNYQNKIVITTGDPNGIGAEITIKALNLLNLPSKDIVLVSNSKILNSYGVLNNNYEIVELKEKTIVGFAGRTSNDDPKMGAVISGLW